MWMFIPRVSSRALSLAGVGVAPAVLLGALANLLLLHELAGLDVWPGPASDVEAWDALLSFRRHVESLLVALFVVLSLGTFTVLRFSPEATLGLNLWASVLVGFLTLAVLNDWTLGGPGEASARIGMGAALWGIAWMMVALHLLLYLRSLRHRHWVWVTTGIGLAYAGVTLIVVILGALASLQIAALLVFLLAALASFVTVMTRKESNALWAATENDRPQTAPAGSKGLPLVAAYMVLAFALIGVAYQHHFDYQPTAGSVHHALMALGFLMAIPLFGLLVRRTGRRTFLLLVPLAAFVPLILQMVQQQHEVLWAVSLAEGVMLASVLFLIQYLLEAVGRLTRMVLFACSLGAVFLMGVGGSLVAQLTAVEAFTPDLLLSLQFAMFFSAMLLAMALPDTTEPVKEEEEIEEYLEVARRVSQESR